MASLGVEGADRFFLDERRIGGDPALVELFRVQRDSWRVRSELYSEHGALWHYVDHGLRHAQQLYAFLPHFVRVLEYNLDPEGSVRAPLLANAAEWFCLASAAYLHDVGMCCQLGIGSEFCRDVLGHPTGNAMRGRIASQHAKDVCQRAVEPDGRVPPQPLTADDMRRLHADLGAWRIYACGGGLFSRDDAERAVAMVVRYHRRATNKAGAPNEWLAGADGQSHKVRVGLLAALIAVADACMVGQERRGAPGAVLEHAQARTDLFRVVADAYKGAQTEQDQVRYNSQLVSLRDQDAHYLKHTVVRRVHFLPDGVILEPESGDEDWFAARCPDLVDLRDPSLPELRPYTNGDLIRGAVHDIGGEVEEVCPLLVATYGADIMPAVQDADPERWPRQRAHIEAHEEAWRNGLPPVVREEVRARITKALQSRTTHWKTLNVVAIQGGVSDDVALDILRENPRAVFKRGELTRGWRARLADEVDYAKALTRMLYGLLDPMWPKRSLRELAAMGRVTAEEAEATLRAREDVEFSPRGAGWSVTLKSRSEVWGQLVGRVATDLLSPAAGEDASEAEPSEEEDAG